MQLNEYNSKNTMFGFISVSMTDNLENDIKTIFLNTFPKMKKQEFELDKKQKEYENWNSFEHMALLTMAENTFGITISYEDSESITSARDLLDYVRSHK